MQLKVVLRRGAEAGRKARLVCGLGSTLFWGTTPASAVPCDGIALPHKIFGAGDSAFTATLKRVALAIGNDTNGVLAEQTTVFYSDPNACDAYTDFLAGKSNRVFKYWLAGSTADQIREARAGGQPLDFAHLPSELDLCGETEPPAWVGSFPAPVQTLSLVTGALSDQTVLSAEALYLIYGFGPSGQVSPWTDGSGVFNRQSTAFVTGLLGRAIQVPASDVPDCAMRAQRDGTLGALFSYAPPKPCGCYFETIASGSAGACEACEADADCSGDTPRCNFGFCEAYRASAAREG